MTPLQVRFPDVERARLRRARRRLRPRPRRRVLEAAQPDISALQEIDNRTTSAARDPFSYFGQLFGWTSVAARTLAARDGHYGHIVLSRWPIESLGEIDLSVRWREPRKAIVGAVASPAGRIVVVAAHLGLLAVRAPPAARAAQGTHRGDPGTPDRRARRLQRLSGPRPRRAQPVPAADADAGAPDLSVAAPVAAARPDLVQRSARADDDRDAARRRPGVRPPAAARELVLARRPTRRRWHGVCLTRSREIQRGPPEWVIPGGILGGRLQTL